MLERILELAERGWQVFPLAPRSKVPLFGKSWKEIATDDEEQIREWWTEHPDANVGLKCGEESGVWVLDLDVDVDKDGVVTKDGRQVLLDYMARTGNYTRPTLRVKTSNGGYHFFYRWNASCEIKNTQSKIGRGIDTRGEGGYVVLPPSIHPDSGTEYAFKDPDHEVADAPDWMTRMIIHGGRMDRAPEPTAGSGEINFVPGKPLQREDRKIPEDKVKEIRSALEYLDPACSYDQWVKIGLALVDVSGGTDEGYVLFADWSARADGVCHEDGKPAYPGEEAVRKKWQHLANSEQRENPVTIRSLFSAAVNAGWQGAPDDPDDKTDEQSGPDWIWQNLDEPQLPSARALFPQHMWNSVRYLQQIADLQQVPFKAVALSALSTMCAATRGRYVVRVPRSEWREPVVLWTIVSAPPGMRKSSFMKDLTWPIREYDRGAQDRDVMTSAKHENDCSRLADMLKRAKDARKKEIADKVESQIRKSDLLTFAQAESPYDPQIRELQASLKSLQNKGAQGTRVSSGAVTNAGLVDFLRDNSGAIAIVDSEGVFTSKIPSNPNGDLALEPWLQGYDYETIAEEVSKLSTTNRFSSRMVTRPSINLTIATQPRKLMEIFSDHADGKGFTARFLTCSLKPCVREKFIKRGEYDGDARQSWKEAITHALTIPRDDTPHEMVLSPEATAKFEAAGQNNLDELRGKNEQEQEEGQNGWHSKKYGKVLRIAATFHAYAEGHTTRPISGDTMDKALSWLSYLEEENAYLHGTMRTDKTFRLAEKILKWAVAGGKSTISRHHVVQNVRVPHDLRGKGPASIVIDGALKVLIDTGWIKEKDTPTRRESGLIIGSKFKLIPGAQEHLEQFEKVDRERGY